MTAWPFDGSTFGFPTSHSTSATSSAEIVQPVSMLLVIAQPPPKSMSLAALGATPSARAVVARTRDARRVASWVPRDMRRKQVNPERKGKHKRSAPLRVNPGSEPNYIGFRK